MSLYFDASALLKRYVEEPGRDLVLDAIATEPSLATSVLTGAELPAALAKAVRMRIATDEMANAGLAEFWRDWPRLSRVRADESLVRHAAELAWRFGLRGYDAVHLASALLLQEAAGEAVTFATFDRQLARAARAMGLDALPDDLDGFLAHLAGPSVP